MSSGGMNMANWIKVLLGLVASAGIFVGVAVFVADQHPLRDSSFYRRDQICGRTNSYDYQSSASESQQTECYARLRRQEEQTESKELWLAGGLGAAAVGLFWLLVWLFYIRPRRRRAEPEGQA